MARKSSGHKGVKSSAGLSGFGLGELFDGISRLVEAASKLKESGLGEADDDAGLTGLLGGLTGQSSGEGGRAGEGGRGGFTRSGEFTIPGLGEKGRGVFGFTIRTMADGPGGRPGGIRIQPFGNVRKGRDGLAVEEARQPVVDVFEEPDCIRVIAELPGVSADAVQHEIRGDILTIRTTGQRCYSAEVLLPGAVKKDAAVASYNNGIFELRLPRG